MAFGFRHDPVGSVCLGSPQPGAAVLGRHLRDRWDLPLLGIYSCRKSTFGGGLSLHAEGRAIDAHVHVRDVEDPPTPIEKVVGDAMAAWCVLHAEDLGIQRVIWLDKEWDSRPGEREFEPYHGKFHGNHIHVELCRDAAETLEQADIDALEDDMFTDQDRSELKETTAAIIQLKRGNEGGFWNLSWLHAAVRAELAALSVEGPDVDPDDLANALVPALMSRLPMLTGAELSAMAKAVNDEMSRRVIGPTGPPE